MRISILKDDPGYRGDTRLFQVRFDGELLDNCVTADEELCAVWVLTNEMRPDLSGEEMLRKRGKVEIIAPSEAEKDLASGYWVHPETSRRIMERIYGDSPVVEQVVQRVWIQPIEQLATEKEIPTIADVPSGGPVVRQMPLVGEGCGETVIPRTYPGITKVAGGLSEAEFQKERERASMINLPGAPDDPLIWYDRDAGWFKFWPDDPQIKPFYQMSISVEYAAGIGISFDTGYTLALELARADHRVQVQRKAAAEACLARGDPWNAGDLRPWQDRVEIQQDQYDVRSPPRPGGQLDVFTIKRVSIAAYGGMELLIEQPSGITEIILVAPGAGVTFNAVGGRWMRSEFAEYEKAWKRAAESMAKVGLVPGVRQVESPTAMVEYDPTKCKAEIYEKPPGTKMRVRVQGTDWGASRAAPSDDSGSRYDPKTD